MKYDELKEKLSNFPAVMVDKTIVIEMIAEITRLRSLVSRLKEDGERLVTNHVGYEGNYRYCVHCNKNDIRGRLEHSVNCPITLHRQLMAEIEKGREG